MMDMEKFSAFYDENANKISETFSDGVNDYKLTDILYNHEKNMSKFDEWKNNIMDIPDSTFTVPIFREYLKFLKEYATEIYNTRYVNIEEYLKRLEKISVGMVAFLEASNIKQIVFLVFGGVKKSNFWVLILVYKHFKNIDVKINIATSTVALDFLSYKDTLFIYPDDTIYSGSQFVKNLGSFLENFIGKKDNPNNIHLTPLVAFIGVSLFNLIKDKFPQQKADDMFGSRFKISGESKLLVNLSTIFDKNIELMNGFNKNIELLEVIHYGKTTNPELMKYMDEDKDGNVLDDEEDEDKIEKERAAIFFLKKLKKQISAYDYEKVKDRLIDNQTLLYYGFLKEDVLKDSFCCKLIVDDKLDEAHNAYQIKKFLFRSFIAKYVNEIPIYFQHKMADKVSVPLLIYETGYCVIKKDSYIEEINIGNMIKNCENAYEQESTLIAPEWDVPEEKRCPKSFYKYIQYSFEGFPITDIGKLLL
jgi:hypothetical protein